MTNYVTIPNNSKIGFLSCVPVCYFEFFVQVVHAYACTRLMGSGIMVKS